MKKGLYGPIYSSEIAHGKEIAFRAQSEFTLKRHCLEIV